MWLLSTDNKLSVTKCISIIYNISTHTGSREIYVLTGKQLVKKYHVSAKPPSEVLHCYDGDEFSYSELVEQGICGTTFSYVKVKWICLYKYTLEQKQSMLWFCPYPHNFSSGCISGKKKKKTTKLWHCLWEYYKQCRKTVKTITSSKCTIVCSYRYSAFIFMLYRSAKWSPYLPLRRSCLY